MNWFRFYSEALDDPKVQRLPGDLFKAWVNLLCLANKSRVRGVLPSHSDIAFALRMDEGQVAGIIDRLQAAELLEYNAFGDLVPHGWEGRQAASDDAAARKRAQRTKIGHAPDTDPDPSGVCPVTSPGTLNGISTETYPVTRPVLDKNRSEEINKNNAHAGTREETADAVSLVAEQPAPPDPQWDAIDPAANHALPERGAHPVPKPSRDDQTVTAYQPIVDAYPPRHGVGPDAEAGLGEFVLIPPGDRPAVLQAVQNYARHPDACKDDGEYVMGLARFLAGGQWRRWVQVAPPGKSTRAAPRAPTELTPYQQHRAAKRAAQAQGVQRA